MSYVVILWKTQIGSVYILRTKMYDGGQYKMEIWENFYNFNQPHMEHLAVKHTLE